ncbi:MAG TPA: ATP phosphoribosyltransferase [Nitrospiria bacterium]|nr:ATP phosphoribosyltransferase [Nitrospiria bacterium]
MSDAKLVIALPKGRLLEPTVELFTRIGIRPKGLTRDTRQLLFRTDQEGVSVMVVRAVDVPTYVEYGAADLGVAGKDVLLEHPKDVYEPVDLGYGLCRVVWAAPAGRPGTWAGSRAGKLRVATKYPNIADRYFTQRGVPIEMVKLWGAVELAPRIGLAESIVDLVSTGKTLEENGLTIVEEIVRSTARLIVNRASMKVKHSRIGELVERVTAVCPSPT